tara:strand:+ start:11083 stop:11202 length:120 start_codon:yes stop_codon:yes gene_type:complete
MVKVSSHPAIKKPADLGTTALVIAVISTYVPPRFGTTLP